MAEHQKMSQKRQEEGDQKQRPRQKKSEPLFDQFHAWEPGTFPIAETPFQPRMDTHAALLAKAHSDTQRANIVMRLQQTYGNRYVQRLLDSMAVQAKLTVSQPGDVYEQEADRVANIVTQKISSSEVQRQEIPEEEELQAKPLLQRQVEEEEEEEVMPKPASEAQRQEIPEEEELQAEPLLQRQVEEEEEEEVQMQPAVNEPSTVPENLETRINDARGSGQPISEEARVSMEQAFGADFSGVKVHTDSEAHGLSESLQARAFTTGQDIFFKSGEYSPGSSSGQQLLAHELTHVVQQRGGQLHGDVQGQTETEIARNLISKSPSDVIQRDDDYLDPAIWKDKSALEDVSRSWKLKAIDKAVKAYHSVKDKDVDTRISALEKITGAIVKWKASKGKGESYKESKRWASVEELQSQAQEAWRLAHLEKKQAKEAAATTESIDEILEGVDRGAKDKAALASTAFQKFIKWCRDKNVNYKTGSAVNILVAGKGPSYCKPLSEALKEVFGAVGVAVSVEKLPQEWFTTKPLPNFIDQTTNGNLKDAGSDYGAGGRRFFFSEHWVAKVNGTVYDPTSGEIGDPAAKIITSGFSKKKRTIDSKEEEVYVKGGTWIRALPGEVDCSAFGYELHSS